MEPTHFTRVALKNFKGHANTQVPLSRFTLLVGANGSGKSSVLEASRLVADALVTPPGTEFGWKSEDLFRDALEIDLIRRSLPEGTPGGSDDLEVELEFGRTGSIGVHLSGPTAQMRLLVGKTETTARFLRQNSQPPEVLAATGAILLRLDPRVIGTPSQSQSELPTIGADGSGLATALKELKANNEARFDEFRRAVRAIIPLVDDFRFARRKRAATRSRRIRVEDQVIDVPESYDVIEDELLVRFTGTGFVRARAASEGTLITIALLGLLYANEQPPRLILIDDLDRGLHIEAQAELVKALRKVLELHPETQIIATGHSPYLADHFEPSEVVVLRRPEPGAAIEATRLSEHPDKVLREFKTGEALVATGKDWFG